MGRSTGNEAWESRWADRPPANDGAEQDPAVVAECQPAAEPGSAGSLFTEEPRGSDSSRSDGPPSADDSSAARSAWLGEHPEEFRARVLQNNLVQDVGRERVEALARRAWRRPVRQGTAVLFCVAVVTPFVDWVEMLLAIPVGASMGYAWHRTRAGAMNSMLIGMTFAWIYFLWAAGVLAAILATLLCAPFSNVLGIQREFPDA